MTRTVMADFAGWPPVGQELVFTEHQNLTAEIRARIETLDTVWTAKANQVIVVNDGATGPVAIGGATGANFANKTVRGFKPYEVAVSGNTTLTDNDHGGALIACTNTSGGITLSLAITGNPATGISSGFRCQILRTTGALSVTLSLSGITNRNPNSHLKVVEARIAEIYLRGTDLYFNGYTSA